MPQSSVRPEVVVLITDVDFDRHDDPTRPYHRDGRPFTVAEHALGHVHPGRDSRRQGSAAARS